MGHTRSLRSLEVKQAEPPKSNLSDFMIRTAENLLVPQGEAGKVQAVNFLKCCRLLSISSPCVCISV